MNRSRKRLKKTLLGLYLRTMGNRYSRKIATILINLSPYVKQRIKTFVANRGIVQPPGNFNLSDRSNSWIHQLDQDELEKMLSSYAKTNFERFLAELSTLKGKAP